MDDWVGAVYPHLWRVKAPRGKGKAGVRRGAWHKSETPGRGEAPLLRQSRSPVNQPLFSKEARGLAEWQNRYRVPPYADAWEKRAWTSTLSPVRVGDRASCPSRYTPLTL